MLQSFLQTAFPWAAWASALAALLTFIKGVQEYRLSNRVKRAEMFLRIREKTKEGTRIHALFAMLDNDDPNLRSVAFAEKRDLLGYFEDVALMVNSGLITAAVAHYMFGYYAIRCSESQHFWTNIDRKSQYWALYETFVKQMTEAEQASEFPRHHLRL